MTKRLKYLYSDKDRHGNPRSYFCPPGHKKTRLKSAPGTPAFKREYKNLFDQYLSGTLGSEKPQHVKKTSTEYLINQYLASAVHRAKSPNTQKQESSYLVRYKKANGHIDFEDVTPKNIAATRDALTPAAGKHFLKALSAVYKWGCMPEVGLCDTNPASAVQRPKTPTDGYLAWSMDDVIKFRNHHPQGSNARICIALLLFTGWEISAVRTLGRGDVRDGKISGKRQKTNIFGSIPVTQILRDELGDMYNERIWLMTKYGKPYSEKGISQYFSKWATDAGLPNHSAHGIRKSVGSILASLGMTPHVIQSVLRHNTTRQGEVYTKEADKEALAEMGMKAFAGEVQKAWNKS